MKFAIVTAIALLGVSLEIAVVRPLVLDSARAQSDRLASLAAAAAGNEAEVDFRLATWLNPANQSAFAGLARAQIAAGEPDAAFASLSRAGQGSGTDQLKVRTLLELGRTGQAAAAATSLMGTGRPDADLLLAAQAAALAGRTPEDSIEGRLGSPEALQRFQRIRAGQLPLAADLYASGLPESSSVILSQLPLSFERNLLLGHIAYDRHTEDSLTVAVNQLSAAVELKPDSVEARQLLVEAYRDLGKTAEAATQAAQLAKLKSGRL